MTNSQSRYLNNFNENQGQSGNRKKVLLKNQGSNQNQLHSNGSFAKNQRAGPIGNHMDILKKFRYNFHYWLRNCYQAEDSGQSNSQMDVYHKAEDVIYKTDKMMNQNSNPNSASKNHSSAPMKQNSSKIKGSEFQHWPHAKNTDSNGKKYGGDPQ